MGELLFNGHRVWEDETVLGVGGGDGGCTTVGMELVPLNCIL